MTTVTDAARGGRCATQIFTAVAKSGILISTKERLAAFAMGLVLLLQQKRRG